MTICQTNHIPRSVTAASAFFVAVLSISVTAVAPAYAEPQPTPGDIDAFNGCVWSELNAVKAKTHRMFTQSDVQKAATDCCQNMAGTANTHGGQYVECYMPDGSTIVADQQAPPPTPPAGATVILPPGSNTRVGE
jgi:hypothetical protein